MHAAEHSSVGADQQLGLLDDRSRHERRGTAGSAGLALVVGVVVRVAMVLAGGVAAVAGAGRAGRTGRARWRLAGLAVVVAVAVVGALAGALGAVRGPALDPRVGRDFAGDLAAVVELDRQHVVLERADGSGGQAAGRARPDALESGVALVLLVMVASSQAAVQALMLRGVR